MFSLINNKTLLIFSFIVAILGGSIWYYQVIHKNQSKTENFTLISEENKPSEENVESNKKIKVYNFNTSWCKYSVMFAPEWSKLQSMTDNDENLEIIDVKCDDESNQQLCQTFDVPGYPSVVIVKDNEEIPYNGPRSAEDILEFIKSL